MSTTKKRGLGRGLSALFGDEMLEPKEKKAINNQNKAKTSHKFKE